MSRFALLLLAVVTACMPAGGDRPLDETIAGRGTLLVRSVPAEGAIVRAPQTLSLTFRAPVRLAEVAIAGPSGEMPMMVTAAGEQTSYSIPLPDLEPGHHDVRWRALARGEVSYEGRLSFTVR